MARVTVRISDLSGNQITEDEAGARLIVEHPDYPEPVGLDVLPDDVLPYLAEENSRFVVVSVLRADDPNPPRYVMTFADFENLFQTGESSSVLQEAYQAQQQEREAEAPRRGRGRRQDSGTRERIDYTSPDHAGEPHRGTISEAEKSFVRVHLDEVNERLRANGQREIDPNDPEMAARYGLVSSAPPA